MEALLLRFDAPLMSFGSVQIDQHNKTDEQPYRAMLTGLLANALGLIRTDTRAHEALQARLRYAARRDRTGTVVVDFQTVDFDPEGAMGSSLGWTTQGRIEARKGGAASTGTHIRYRHFLADAIVTVALSLDPIEGAPTLGELSDALRRPARPLFIGRKCCVPSAPIWLGHTEAESLRAALEKAPRVDDCAPKMPDRRRRGDLGGLLAIWSSAEGGEDDQRSRTWPRVEDRDWDNSIHVGRRLYVEGTVNPPDDDGGIGADAEEMQP